MNHISHNFLYRQRGKFITGFICPAPFGNRRVTQGNFLIFMLFCL